MVPKFWGCKFTLKKRAGLGLSVPSLCVRIWTHTLCRHACQRSPTDLGVCNYVQYEALGYACIKVLRIPWLIPARHFIVAHLSVKSYSVIFTYTLFEFIIVYGKCTRILHAFLYKLERHRFYSYKTMYMYCIFNVYKVHCGS